MDPGEALTNVHSSNLRGKSQICCQKREVPYGPKARNVPGQGKNGIGNEKPIVPWRALHCLSFLLVKHLLYEGLRGRSV